METTKLIESTFFKRFSKETYFLWGIGLLVFIASAIQYADDKSNPVKNNPTELSTYIPKGFNLVPIDVSNIEKVDSLIGQNAIVHVFSTLGKNQRLLAKNLRLLRSPKNPSVFAVLVPISETPYFLDQGPTYNIGISGNSSDGTEIVKPKRKPTQDIFYESF